ncbi:MAG: 1-acyl-sn-glycerol-3-phosphate acyltransferase [Candidatus Obscuribacterales bacterium]|nr:1-acyl-sn-glycerol-3-phosphate acyltransferase [Candidatus Obscuribacterales bacterium]
MIYYLPFVFLFGIWFSYWCYQGWMLSHRSGHYAPMITALPRLLRWGVGCLVARVFVGRVTINGWENVANCKGRLIITPKHVSIKDAALVAKLARTYKLRFLIAINQTKGLRGPPLAWMGAISVGYDKNNPALAGANAAKAAVEAMTAETDSILVIFPEGALDRENKLVRERYRPGFVRIGKGCQKVSEQQWFAIPVDVQYHLFGATVTFGVPIAFAHLPDDEKLATDHLFDVMVQMRAGGV